MDYRAGGEREMGRPDMATTNANGVLSGFGSDEIAAFASANDDDPRLKTAAGRRVGEVIDD